MIKLVWFHTTCHQELERKIEVNHVLMTGFIHLHFIMPTISPTSVNTYILNLGLGNMLIKGYMSLSHNFSGISRSNALDLFPGQSNIVTALFSKIIACDVFDLILSSTSINPSARSSAEINLEISLLFLILSFASGSSKSEEFHKNCITL